MQLCWSKCLSLSLSVSQVTVLTSAMCTWSALSTTLCCVLSLSCFRTLWREGQGGLGVAGYTQDCMRVPVFRETLNVQEVPAQRRMKVWSLPSLSSPSPLLFRLLSYSLLTCSLPCWAINQGVIIKKYKYLCLDFITHLSTASSLLHSDHSHLGRVVNGGPLPPGTLGASE